jgi:hypothetical protein
MYNRLKHNISTLISRSLTSVYQLVTTDRAYERGVQSVHRSGETRRVRESLKRPTGEGYTSIEFVRRPHWINFNVFTLWLNHMKKENGPMQCIIQNGELDCRHIKKHSWVYIPSQPHRLWNVERARLESCRSWVRFITFTWYTHSLSTYWKPK